MAVKRRKPSKLIVLLITIITLTASYFGIKPEMFGIELDENEYKVVRVVDGDTIKVEDSSGNQQKVRMIGVDTPESVHPNPRRNSPFGKIASKYTKDRLLGKTVELEYDVSKYDRYGRTLAYIFLDNKMFNMELLEEGYAKIMTIPPNVKYSKVFLKVQQKAREDEKGIWKNE